MQVNLPVNVLPVTFPGHGHSQTFNAPDDLPKAVARTLNQGSSPTSMDFHPVQQTLLLGLLTCFFFILYLHLVFCFWLAGGSILGNGILILNTMNQLVPMLGT